MKSVLVSAVGVLVIAGISYAGEKKISKKEVPAAVVASFEKSYPAATVNGYAREMDGGKTYFEIESIEGKTHRDVLYTADGMVAELEETMTLEELPERVRSAVQKKFAADSITGIEKTTAGGTVRYEVHVMKGKMRHEVVFDGDGRVVTKEESKSTKEED